MPTTVQWFYAHAGQQRGPMEDSAFRAMAARGEVLPSDLVWKAGMAQWAPASTVAGLVPATTESRPLPPPIPAGGMSPGGLSAGAKTPGSVSPGAMPASGFSVVPIAYASPQPRDIGQDAGIRMLLPVGRSGWAIAAGYLGLFSVLVIPAPIAVIVSIIAIRHMKKDPTQHGMGRAIFGLIMGGLVLIVMAIGLTAVLLGK